MSRPAPSIERPTVRLFNVKFSPNLGDGLLSECLEHALVGLGAATDSHSIDLAARARYGEMLTARGPIMATLDALPGPVRATVIRLPMAIARSRKWRPHYAAGLQGADCIAIGGGNLLSDIDLNFPTKIALAMEESDRLGLPAVLYGCGVSSGWSKRGIAMATQAFTRANFKGVFVRDEASRQLWEELFSRSTGKQATVVRDPGLLAADVYPNPPRPVEGPRRVGIGIMSPVAIRFHGSVKANSGDLSRWYIDLARQLVDAGHEVVAFTNGSPEDREFLETLRAPLGAIGNGDAISFPTQQTPAELCRHIASLDVLVAHRMHAIIAAYSYGVPAIALAWDRKLESFMASVGRGDLFRDVETLSPAECAALVARAEPIAEQERRNVIAEAHAGVAQLFDLLRASL